MPIALDATASLVARLLEPWIGFWASLSHSWLDTTGSMADPGLGDQRAQTSVIGCGVQSSRGPRGAHLHRVLEADLPWMDAGMAGGLRHELTDHVVGQQVNPKLLLIHARCLATQYVHAQGCLEVSQIQLNVPAPREQRLQAVLAQRAGIAHRGDQNLMGDPGLAQRQLLGQVGVLLRTHPLRAPRLGPAHQMIARAQRVAAPKVGDARAMLFEQHVHAAAMSEAITK